MSLMSIVSVWGMFLLFLSHSQASDDELKVEVLYKPRICMKKSQTNNMLKVQYKVFFENGTLFHSSYEKDQVMHVPLGLEHPSSDVETGFREMCVGEKRLLTVPHHGQGDWDLPLQNGGVIPANTPLLYEVELIEIEDKIDVKQGFESIDFDGDNHITLEEIMEQIKTIQASGIGLKHEVLEDLYQNLLTAADVNKDGKISKDEYRDILPHDFRDEL